MKQKLLFLFFVAFTKTSLQAQMLAPSTIREVFNFEVGDTFMYKKIPVHVGASGSVLNTKIVKSKILHNDSLTYLIENFRVSSGVFGSGFSSGNETLTYTKVDSSFFSYTDSLYPKSIPFQLSSFDTIYYDSSIGINSKIMSIERSSMSMSYFEMKFTDSIGLIFDHNGDEAPAPDSYENKLIYYHKANGRKWGTPETISGINDIESLANIQLYPNPACDKSILYWQDFTAKENTFIKLYDVCGKEVRTIAISSAQTTIDKIDLASGLYFWQLIKDNSMLRKGKLIFE